MATIITHNNIQYEISDKYSNKDMTGWDLSLNDDMNGIVVYNSCLSNETPNAKILPPNLIGSTFIDCNLDNVLIPIGNIVIDCSIRKFQIQNDNVDWIVDDNLKPIEPVSKVIFILQGKSIDPTTIPLTKQAPLAPVNSLAATAADDIISK